MIYRDDFQGDIKNSIAAFGGGAEVNYAPEIHAHIHINTDEGGEKAIGLLRQIVRFFCGAPRKEVEMTPEEAATYLSQQIIPRPSQAGMDFTTEGEGTAD